MLGAREQGSVSCRASRASVVFGRLEGSSSDRVLTGIGPTLVMNTSTMVRPTAELPVMSAAVNNADFFGEHGGTDPHAN